MLSVWQRWWMSAWPHRGLVRWHVPRFLRACPEPFRGEVLEIGAGTGWTTRRLLETFPQVALTAVDADHVAVQQLEWLRERYGQRLTVAQANALDLPFDRAAFDVVVAINVLRFLPDKTRAVAQWLRVLRPGGLLGISDREAGGLLAQVEKLLLSEGCKVLYRRAGWYYSLWAQKAYPVEA